MGKIIGKLGQLYTKLYDYRISYTEEPVLQMMAVHLLKYCSFSNQQLHYNMIIPFIAN